MYTVACGESVATLARREYKTGRAQPGDHMTAPNSILTPRHHLEHAVPPKPEELFRLHRLCLWIYNSFTSDMKERGTELAAAAGTGLKKKERQTLQEALAGEMPVLLLIHALERLE